MIARPAYPQILAIVIKRLRTACQHSPSAGRCHAGIPAITTSAWHLPIDKCTPELLHRLPISFKFSSVNFSGVRHKCKKTTVVKIKKQGWWGEKCTYKNPPDNKAQQVRNPQYVIIISPVYTCQPL